MPSGHKKRKSAKRKNKASDSLPHQDWIRSHMQILKAPSFGNRTEGQEKHTVLGKEAVGNGDREKGEENAFFEFKGGEAARASEMDASGNEVSVISAMDTGEFPSEDENSQKGNVLKMSALDKSAGDLQETEKSELFESNGFSEESVTSDAKVDCSGGLEEKGGEDKHRGEIEVDKSLEDDLTSQVKGVAVAEEGEAGHAVEKKEEVILAHEFGVSACEKDDKVMIDAHRSIEVPQGDERGKITPKIEASHPTVVRRASVWNCCGLLEVFMTSQR